jgi:hypothetical protein
LHDVVFDERRLRVSPRRNECHTSSDDDHDVTFDKG